MKTQRILIVEDEKTLSFALRENLIDDGLNVDVAAEGNEALRLFKAKRYDVVVTDLKMPGMSGLELLTEIRKISASTEVIIVTAYGSMEMAVEALRLRAFDFLMKPYTMEQLKDSIKRALELAGNQKQVPNSDSMKPVQVSKSDTFGFSVSWDSEPLERISYCLDLYKAGGRTYLVYFEADSELLKVSIDLLGEMRGFLRNGLFKGQSQAEIKADLKAYIGDVYGVSSGWRLFVAEHDDKKEKLRVSWEGNHQHLLFSRRKDKAYNFLSHPGLKKVRGRTGEFQLEFSGGDSLLFLPWKMVDYINKRMGLMEFLSVIESCLRDDGKAPAEKIRQAVRIEKDAPPPGILVVSAKDSVGFADRLTVTVRAEQDKLVEMKYLAEQVCSQCGCSDDETFDVVMALNEALLNSILHGYRCTSGDIKVLFARKGTGLSIEVRDRGCGFVYRYAAAEPEDSYDWVTRGEGRGLSMMKKLMDKVAVKSLPGKGTTVKMLKKVSERSGGIR